MTSESVSISGPVRIESDSKSRVAFDLMIMVDKMTRDNPSAKNLRNDKKYWFILYEQCLGCVHGQSLDKLMEMGNLQ